MEFLLPPSKVDPEKIIDVAAYIFDANIMDMNHFRCYCIVEYTADKSFHPKNQITNAVDQTLQVYLKDWSIIHNITIQEDCGYHVLGDLLISFAYALKEEFGQEYRYHPQRDVCKNANPGRNPSTDCAIVHRLCELQTTTYVSKVIYEYKPAIHSSLLLVDPSQLIELLLQAHYTMRYEDTSTIIGCLTDLMTWHYFKLTMNKSHKLTILWYHKLFMDIPPSTTKEQLQTHLAFVLYHFQQDFLD